jgi:EAL domain-containing protein (putative c-di-GMP-specific phosphodiesterase class I)
MRVAGALLTDWQGWEAPAEPQEDWSGPLTRVLDDPDQPRLVFQPIVDLTRGAVVGYEALARFDRPPLATPDQWFRAAAEAGCGAELEARVLRSARSALRSLPPNCFLTVNLSPQMLCTPAVEAALSGGSLSPLVLELTEQVELVEYGQVRSALERYRAAGLTVAVDDAGDGYAGLQRLLAVRPQLVKLDRSLTAEADRDEAQRALTEMVGTLAGRLDAWFLVEGIERPRQLEAFIRLGVPLGQGNLLGRPDASWSLLDPAVAALIRNLSGQRKAPDDEVLGLIERAPSVPHACAVQATELFDAQPDMDLAVVIDDAERPLGLLTRSDAYAGRPYRRATLCVSSATDIAELAARSMTRPSATRFDPPVCCDGRGRYVGVVRMERVVERLAERSSGRSAAALRSGAGQGRRW